MNFSGLLMKVLKTGGAPQELEQRHKVFLHVFISYVAMLILLMAGLRFIPEKNTLNIAVFFSALALLLVNRIIFPPARDREISSRILTVVTGIILLFCFYSGTGIPYAWPWIFIYPVLAMILNGTMKGLIFSIILPLLCLPGIFLHDIFPLVNSDIFFLMGIFTGYFTVTLLFFFFGISADRESAVWREQMENATREAESKNEFISRLSHQLRTSLNNILLVNNLVNSAGFDDSQKDLIDTLQASTNNLVDAVNKIVDVSKTDMIQLKETSISFELGSTLENIIKLFRNNERIEIEHNVSDLLVNYIVGDPVKLKQIFLNLLQSIVQQAGDSYLRLMISASPGNENRNDINIHFSIESCFTGPFNENTGSHLNDECLPPPEGFTAIDLANTSRLIGFSGGKLVSEKKDHKNIFTFTLVYQKDLSRRIDQPVEKLQIQESQKAVDLKNSNVLLVEDNLINQKIVLLSLKNTVRNVDVALNGKEALDKFGTSKYDIILMDIQMPVMDGIIATKKIREIESSTNTQTPIIAITANALAGDREKCLAVGMNDYISKPFQVDILINKMKRLLEEED